MNLLANTNLLIAKAFSFSRNYLTRVLQQLPEAGRNLANIYLDVELRFELAPQWPF